MAWRSRGHIGMIVEIELEKKRFENVRGFVKVDQSSLEAGGALACGMLRRTPTVGRASHANLPFSR